MFLGSEDTIDAPRISGLEAEGEDRPATGPGAGTSPERPPIATVRVSGGAPPPSGPAQLEFRRGAKARFRVVTDAPGLSTCWLRDRRDGRVGGRDLVSGLPARAVPGRGLRFPDRHRLGDVPSVTYPAPSLECRPRRTLCDPRHALAIVLFAFARTTTPTTSSPLPGPRRPPARSRAGSQTPAAAVPAAPRARARSRRSPEIPVIVVKGGKPVAGGVRSLEFTKGDVIRFTVRSDVADHVHLHGYDVFKDVPAGGSVTFAVPADLDGLYEVELEDRVEPLAEITVNPELMLADISAPLVLAHALAARQDLPIPEWLFAWAASVVLIVSFFALSVGWREPRFEGDHWRPLSGRPSRIALHPLLLTLCGALGVFLLLGVAVYAGLGGTVAPDRNFALTFIFVTAWLGFPVLSVILGDVFRAFNPWRAIGRAAGAAFTRLVGQAPAHLAYPERLGRWPAAIGLAAFVLARDRLRRQRPRLRRPRPGDDRRRGDRLHGLHARDDGALRDGEVVRTRRDFLGLLRHVRHPRPLRGPRRPPRPAAPLLRRHPLGDAPRLGGDGCRLDRDDEFRRRPGGGAQGRGRRHLRLVRRPRSRADHGARASPTRSSSSSASPAWRRSSCSASGGCAPCAARPPWMCCARALPTP